MVGLCSELVLFIFGYGRCLTKDKNLLPLCGRPGGGRVRKSGGLNSGIMNCPEWLEDDVFPFGISPILRGFCC